MRRDLIRILKYFFLWRVALFIIAASALLLIPVFGARFPYTDRVLTITHLPPWIWGFGNFDGVHYLRIAQDGYKALASQAFFPLYPILIKILAWFVPKVPNLNVSFYVDPAYFYSAFTLSHAFFAAALYFFYRLLNLDFKDRVSRKAILLLLVFPTAFYFGAIYTESLFLFLAVTAIYLVRTKKYLPAALFVALASLTRVIGVLLIFVYVTELYRDQKWSKGALLGLLILPLGIVAYMAYLNATLGDPLYFLHTQPVFGADRAGSIILLPQVFYRYFKILTTINPTTWPFFNAVLELCFTVVPLAVVLFLYKKMRLSYWIFTLAVLLLPTLTGTLSSMPRYVLMAFLALPYITSLLNRKVYVVMLVIMAIFQAILLALFVRGYWVA